MGGSRVDKHQISLLGVPSSAGARRAGQELGPRSLRRAGLLERLRHSGREVMDLGDLTQVVFAPDPLNPRQRNLQLVARVVEDVAGAVDAVVADGGWPLVVGGDCTVTIGVLAALTRRFDTLGLIYLDGDVDLNTPETTLTGVFDGMALAHILGRGVEELNRSGSRYPLVDERNVTLFGYSPDAGGIDPAEIAPLHDTEMARYPLDAIASGVEAAAARALRELEQRVEHILVHFDVDVVDFDDLPATDVPHRPGLGLSETTQALRVFLESPKVVGLVLTEFNAMLDSDGTLAVRLSDALERAMMPA